MASTGKADPGMLSEREGERRVRVVGERQANHITHDGMRDVLRHEMLLGEPLGRTVGENQK
jgi:hypothetical protein